MWPPNTVSCRVTSCESSKLALCVCVSETPPLARLVLLSWIQDALTGTLHCGILQRSDLSCGTCCKFCRRLGKALTSGDRVSFHSSSTLAPGSCRGSLDVWSCLCRCGWHLHWRPHCPLPQPSSEPAYSQRHGRSRLSAGG